MRSHLFLLLAVTLLVQAVMFVSYPLGGMDDNQSAQRYLVDELLSGNLLIGSLRFNTGYAFGIAPVTALAGIFERIDDRVVLLFQVTLAALIPFLIYDIIRHRRPPGEALGAALFIALDPFGLQWAHFMLPVWWVAFGLVLALWLIERGWRIGQPLRYTLLAGLVCGAAVLARANVIPVVAALGGLFLLYGERPLRQRLILFFTLGLTSAGMLLAYLLLIHYPSTGTLNLSCISGQNMLVSAFSKGLPITPANGPTTAYVFDFLTLESPVEITFFADTYDRWQQPGPWATPEEQAAFFDQPYGERAQTIRSIFPPEMFYYLGPCETDSRLRGVHHEAVAAAPGVWAAGVIADAASMLVQYPRLGGPFAPMYLPNAAGIVFESGGRLGFTPATGDYYNGQTVWQPGIRLYSAVFDVLQLLKWLTPLALVWAWRTGDRFYRTAAALLLVNILAIALLARPEPRYFAVLYPVYGLLIGAMLAAGWRRAWPGS